MVYSKEEALVPIENENIKNVDGSNLPGADRTHSKRRSIPGSVAFVPSVVGLIISGEVIKDLIK